jgi:hypothetical protein
MPDATYYKTMGPTGTETFHCLYCARAGQEHHATDPALFTSHMAQRHDGRMVEGQQPEEPAPVPVEEDEEDVPAPDEDEEGEDVPEPVAPPPVPTPMPPPAPHPAPDPEPVPEEPPTPSEGV